MLSIAQQYNLCSSDTNLMTVSSVLQDEADYSGLIRALKPSSSGYLTSASECMLRAAQMEDIITEHAAFNEQTLTEGYISSRVCFRHCHCHC